jgi:hypothetical protein
MDEHCGGFMGRLLYRRRAAHVQAGSWTTCLLFPLLYLDEWTLYLSSILIYTMLNSTCSSVTGRTKSTTFVITCLDRRHHLLPCTAHHVTMKGKNLYQLVN